MIPRESSARIPSAWEQAYPRAVRLAPGGMLVPSGTLRTLLRKSGRLEVVYTGFALEPRVRDGQSLVVDARRVPESGDLALCDIEGWGDVRRILRRASDGTCLTALDPYPPGRELLPAGRVMATVTERRRAPGVVSSVSAMTFPAWSRWAALHYWFRKIIEAPDFKEDAVDSVKRKYASQVQNYTDMLVFPQDDELRTIVRQTVQAGGPILIAGAGAGGEVIRFAREGYRVTGVDYLKEMVNAAEKNARAAGVDVELLCADMSDLDLRDRRFGCAYITPLVYSFVPGRARRVQSLRRLGTCLVEDGAVIFSAYLLSNPTKWLQTFLAWARHKGLGRSPEFGDWFTWFLRADGSLGKSFTHLFATASVVSEAREAGFRECRKVGGYFIARRFTPGRR